MWLSRYWFTQVSTALTRRSALTQSSRRRPPLTAEELEDRTTPATITPITFADGIGIGSLRDAILQANSNGQNNTIVLSAGTYELSIAGRNETAGQTGDLNLTAFGNTETIQGAGAGATVINANQIDRVFEVQSNVKVILSNLTIAGGQARDEGAIGGTLALGGGILNNGGNLTLDHVVVAYNAALPAPLQSAQGGGIYMNGGALTITDSTITSNIVLGSPGVNGNKAQTNYPATIPTSANRAFSNDGGYGGSGSGALGGGLYVGSGALTITGSVIASNQAQGGNGGNGGTGGPVPGRFANSNRYLVGTGPFFFDGVTIGSSGSGGGSRYARSLGYGGIGGNGGLGGGAQGGGLYVASGTVNIVTTTITANSATGGAGGNGGAPGINGHSGYGDPGGTGQAGGVYVAGGNVALLNSALTGNLANQATGGAPGMPDYDGKVGLSPLGQGGNLLTAGGSIETTGSTVTNQDKVGVVHIGSDGGTNFMLDAAGTGSYTPSLDPSYQFGVATDQFLSGDWSGDGSDQIGVARANANGGLTFTLDTNGDGVYDASDQVFNFGAAGDTAIVGDWNGAGKDEVGVVRPTAQGGLQFILDTNGDGVYDAGDQVFNFGGLAGDHVVVGDWNGAGKDEIGVVRPDGNGGLVWVLDTNGDGTYDGGDSVYHYGVPGDQPVVGDWTGSGRDNIGVARPLVSQNLLLFTLDANGDGVFDAGDQVCTFGQPGDTVLIGKWNPPGQQLLAAGLPPSSSQPPDLTVAELAPLVTEATDLWMTTGLNAQQIQNLQQETVLVDTLPNGLLGSTRGDTITLSPNAAGFGWYVDPTPTDNAEFPGQTPQGFQAVAGSPAAGQMDLLTTILHEEGHVLGLPDLNPTNYPGDIMTGTLPVGTRRLPRFGETTTFPGES